MMNELTYELLDNLDSELGELEMVQKLLSKPDILQIMNGSVMKRLTLMYSGKNLPGCGLYRN